MKTLNVFDFHKRIGSIDASVGFSIAAIQNRHEQLQPQYKQFAERMASLVDTLPEHPAFPEGWLGEFMRDFQHAEPSERLLLNLSLVMLCTEMEVFITHLVDVILAHEPRLLLSTASDKQLSTSEIVAAKEYENVLAKLRDKVADEITNCAAEKMFLHHLGKRFGLINEAELTPNPASHLLPGKVVAIPIFEGWNRAELAKVFETRHAIVHKGVLPVGDREYIGKVATYFHYLELLLSRNARRRYTIPMNVLDFGVLTAFCRIYTLDFDPERESKENLIKLDF